mgnify:CR=1 FL=1
MSDLILTPGVGPAADVDASLADVGPGRSLASDAWRRFKRNKLAMFGLVLVVVLALPSASVAVVVVAELEELELALVLELSDLLCPWVVVCLTFTSYLGIDQMVLLSLVAADESSA